MHTIKQVTFFFLLMSLGFSINGKAQTNDSLLNQLSAKWENAKTYTLKMADLMSAENYGFRPVAEEMSFKEQLLHIANNMKWLSSSFLFSKRSKQVSDTATLDKASIILSDAYDEALTAHHLNEKQLGQSDSYDAAWLWRTSVWRRRSYKKRKSRRANRRFLHQ